MRPEDGPDLEYRPSHSDIWGGHIFPGEQMGGKLTLCVAYNIKNVTLEMLLEGVNKVCGSCPLRRTRRLILMDTPPGTERREEFSSHRIMGICSSSCLLRDAVLPVSVLYSPGIDFW